MHTLIMIIRLHNTLNEKQFSQVLLSEVVGLETCVERLQRGAIEVSRMND